MGRSFVRFTEMVKRRTEINKRFEPTQDTAAKMGRREGCRRRPEGDKDGVRPVNGRPGERLLLEDTTPDLELKERGGCAPNYKGRVERLFRHRALSLTSVPGRRERR